VADASITIGAILLAYDMIIGHRKSSGTEGLRT
jgi:lipoprotein signal peptidase